ncbi:MAG: hypothetical protein ACE5J0_03395 [Candidatus Paceibacterales bacterium]
MTKTPNSDNILNIPAGRAVALGDIRNIAGGGKSEHLFSRFGGNLKR